MARPVRRSSASRCCVCAKLMIDVHRRVDMDAGGNRHTVDGLRRQADAGDNNGGGRCVDDRRATSMAMDDLDRWWRRRQRCRRKPTAG
ncbi:hypothetical protein ACLOJK_039868 [Asimina triloba]